MAASLVDLEHSLYLDRRIAGSDGTPIVVRAWRPASPNTATARSEAPFITCACGVNSGCRR